MQTQRLQKGFTLIELGIALMIIGILTATFTPGLIAATRNKLIEKVAEDMRIIAEATMVYQAQHEGTLPGEPDAEGDCVTSNAINVLKGDERYLPDTLQDPWGGDYELVYAPVDDTCITKIKTAMGTLPSTSHTMLSAMLPATECSGDGATSQCVTTDLTFVAGGSDALAGQIKMFAGDCPRHLGWDPYADLQGRFPRGMQTDATWADTFGNAEIYQGGGDTMRIDYEHLGFGGGGWGTEVLGSGEMGPYWMAEAGIDGNWGGGPDGEGGQPDRYAIDRIGFTFGDNDQIISENSAQTNAYIESEMLPSYAYVQYCIKN